MPIALKCASNKQRIDHINRNGAASTLLNEKEKERESEWVSFAWSTFPTENEKNAGMVVSNTAQRAYKILPNSFDVRAGELILLHVH